MPSVAKPSRRREFTRSIVDAVKSIYSTRSISLWTAADDTQGVPRSRKTSRVGQSRSHTHAYLHGYNVHRYHPIMCLPNEVLAHIFTLGAEDDASFPVIVSHVCRAWRNLALHTPSLWRRIAVDDRLDMWLRRIQRAKACTLDIQLTPRTLLLNGLYYTTTLSARTVQAYMNLIAPLIPRWRSLEIKFDAYAPYLWNAALCACCANSSAVQALRLEELRLIYPGNDDTKDFNLFNGHAPRLRRAVLLGIRLVWLPALFQNLTYLDYTHHGFTRGQEAASEVLHILQTCSRLEELRLAFPWKGDSASRYSVPAPWNVHLPCLKTLILNIEGPEVPSALLVVLLHLSVPAARSLRLLSRYPFRRPTLFPRLRHALRAMPELPGIEHLYLEHGWLDPRFVFPLLHDVPRLQYLVLVGPRVTGPFLLGLMEAIRARRTATGEPVPLRALELVRCDGLSAGDIMHVIKANSFKEVPCLELLIIRDCPGVDASSLRGLQTAVPIVKIYFR